MKTLPSLLIASLVAVLPVVAQDPEPDPPVAAFNFTVEIEGITAGAFQSVEGLSAEIEVIEYQDGSDLILRKRPGRTKYGDITLKRGYIANQQLQQWWEVIRAGQYEGRNISIHLNDGDGERLRTWQCLGCWPKAWKINGFDGKGNDVVTEEITFAVEELLIGG